MIILKKNLHLIFAASSYLAMIAAPAFAGPSDGSSLCVGGPENTITFSSSFTPDDTISIRIGSSNKSVDLPNSYSGQVKAVCRVALNKAVVFNWLTGAYSVSIVDLSTLSIVDSFQAYTPSLSPKGTFLVYRAFYPYQIDSPICEMYLVYDFRKEWSKQRTLTANGSVEVVGKIVYPITRNNELFEPYLVAQNHVHRFASDGFFWSDDEDAIVSGDSVLDQLQIVMVDPNGRLQTRVKLIGYPDVCASGSATGRANLVLKSSQVGDLENLDRPVIATFASGSIECSGQPVTLLSSVVRHTD